MANIVFIGTNMERNNLFWFSEKIWSAIALYKQKLECTDDWEEFVTKFEESAHIKESKNLTYKLINNNMLHVFGCLENEVVNKNVLSFLGEEVMKSRWIDNYARKIHEFDLSLIALKQPIKYIPDPILDKNGFVFVHSSIKMPLLGKSEKVIGIVTFTFNIINNLRVKEIRQCYTKLYGSSTFKNRKFGEQIGIPLLGLLTEREIDCLLSAIRYRSGKLIAKDLSISAKTVDLYLGRIREKLNCNYTDDLINYFLTATEKKGFSMI
jgi:DNA-binding CsgD family transcriptional regulator